MSLSLTEKAAAFCRELADSALQEVAARNGAGEAFERARAALRDRQVDATLETDLDLLDAAAQAEGLEFYVSGARIYPAWPGSGSGSGAQWWACPDRRCAGRGRVLPGQQPPVCAATGKPLQREPLRK